MKMIVPVALLVILACATVAFGQARSMYDPSYSGPVNYYGQPAYSLPTNPQPGYVQQQQPFPGLVPMGIQQAQGVGSYLWSYMPAPWRGGPDPYPTPSGTPTVTFVPGNQ